MERPSTDGFGARRRQVLGATAGGLALGALGVGRSTATGDAALSDHSLTIVHDTHFHGRFEDDTAGIAEYWALAQEELAANDRAIFVGGGDEFSPSLAGSWFEGENIVEALNLMDPAGIAVGNHENDFGAERMRELFAESDFPWLATNLSDGAGNPYPETEQWVVEEVGGLRVGILGISPPGWTPEGGESLDLVDSMQSAIDYLREEEGVDYVVAGSHLGGSQPKRRLAREVDGLDAVVGDHYATVAEEAIVEEGTVISLAGDEYDHLATLTIDDGGLVDRRLHALEDLEVEPDPEMADLVAEYQAVLDEELSEPVAVAGDDLDARFNSNYNLENEYENLVVEAMAERTGAEVAIQNAGGIRSNRIYEEGEFTAGDVYETLPFPDPAVRAEVTGEELRELLLGRVGVLPGANFGAQPQIGVHEIQYDWHGIEEAEVSNVHVHGEPLDPDATYTAALSSVMASILADVRGLEDADPADVGEETDTVGNLMIEHCRDLGYLEPKIHNRIHRYDEPQGAPTDVSEADGLVYLTYPEPEHSLGIHTQTFYAVSRTGTRIEAADVRAADGTVRVGFRADQLRSLVTGVDDPAVRVFGGFDPDTEGYDLVPEGEDEPRDLPVAARLDYFVMRGRLDPATLPFDRSEGDAGGDDDAGGDGTPTEEGGDESRNVGESDETVPGFGPLAALAGVGAGAYAMSKAGDGGD